MSTTVLAKIEPTELDTVINSSGLAIAEVEATKQQYLPYLIQLAEIQEQASKQNQFRQSNRCGYDNRKGVEIKDGQNSDWS